MARSFLSEDEMKEFNDRIKATNELGKKFNIKFTSPETIQHNTLEVVSALYTERLEKSSKRLNYLTLALVGLTIILAVFTVILVCK
jgi:hypothetical protein